MGLYNDSAALAMLMLLRASLAHKATRPGCTRSTNFTIIFKIRHTARNSAPEACSVVGLMHGSRVGDRSCTPDLHVPSMLPVGPDPRPESYRGTPEPDLLQNTCICLAICIDNLQTRGARVAAMPRHSWALLFLASFLALSAVSCEAASHPKPVGSKVWLFWAGAERSKPFSWRIAHSVFRMRAVARMCPRRRLPVARCR